MEVVSVCMFVYILICFIFLMYKTQLYFGVSLRYMCNIYDKNNRGFVCAIVCVGRIMTSLVAQRVKNVPTMWESRV